jgi:hypothetical protein
MVETIQTNALQTPIKVKFVINEAYGGFGLSEKAIEKLVERGIKDPERFEYEIDEYRRYHPDLVEVVEELGDEASGRFSKLIVVEVEMRTPYYYIDEYDGREEVVVPESIDWGICNLPEFVEEFPELYV